MVDNDRTPGTASVGLVQESFRPSIRNIVAGIAIALLFGGGGLALIAFGIYELWHAKTVWPIDASNGRAWVLVVVGPMFLLLGGFVSIIIPNLLGYQIDWCERGLVFYVDGEIDEVAWNSVTAIEETQIYEHLPILAPPLNHLMPRFCSKKYKIETAGGKSFEFDGNYIGEYQRFCQMLRDRAERGGIPVRVILEYEGLPPR